MHKKLTQAAWTALPRVVIVMAMGLAFRAALPAQLPDQLGAAEWYRPPKLAVMIGFIKDPQHRNFTVPEWAKGIGAKFDAPALVERCRRAGVAQIIWYDKWIDGLVFRRTKTTSYVTERDFLAELAPECRKRGVKLVIYFNTFYDGNPEFAQWAAVDQRGRPISFSPFWPENLLSMYSPFREKALEQIRELVVDYQVDGIWLDVPGYALMSYDRWTREAFRTRHGKDMDDGTLTERRRFAVESAVNWNREVAAFVRKLNPAVTVTTNEKIDPLVEGPARAASMAQVVDYFTTELHTSELQLSETPYLANAAKPFEVITLLSDDWFTPLHSGPVKTSKSPVQMHVELANVFSAGLNLGGAITLAHDGSLDEHTLKMVDLAGEWLRERMPYLQDAEDWHDVAILLGTPDPAELDWPGGLLSGDTRMGGAARANYNDAILALEQDLRRRGYLPRRLVNLPPCRSDGEIPGSVRAVIVPDRAQLSSRDQNLVERFAKGGGTVVALGRGGMLTAVGHGEPGRPASLFGTAGHGYAAVGPAVLLGEERVSVSGPVLHLRPGAAQTLMWANDMRAGDMPFVTRSTEGAGKAYLVASPEWALTDKPEILDALWTEALGDPAFRITMNSDRYTVRVRRQKGRHILHVIDVPKAVEGPMRRYRPLYTKLAINARHLPFQKASLVPGDRELTVTAEGSWKVLEVFPDPELTIVLE